MQPHEISGHRVRDALQTIFDELSTLQPSARAVLAAAFRLPTADDVSPVLDAAIEAFDMLHPFVPIPERQRDEYAESMLEQFRDMGWREMASDLLPQSEWAWRAELDEHRASLEQAILESEPASREEFVAYLDEWDALERDLPANDN